MDRAELAGTGAALAFHVAVIAALSLHLASVDTPPEPPSMEVEMVDDIALTAAAPQAVTAPPVAQAPEIGEAEPLEPAPAPMVEPTPPPPQIVPAPTRPQPAPTPAPPVKRTVAKPAPAKPAPARPAPAKPTAARPAPARPAPARPAPRASRIGDDFLKGIADDAPARPRAPAAATFNAAAKADVASAIAAQIRPCALRQRALGDGANRIRVVLNLRLTLSGRLKGAPTVIRTTGVDEDNAQYEELVKDQAIASYRECAPLRLPAELYQTASGGWSNINMTYRLP
jgi:outer membrane biosynthesis protein TonB